jgi:hypothetical protein
MHNPKISAFTARSRHCWHSVRVSYAGLNYACWAIDKIECASDNDSEKEEVFE